QNQKEKEKRKNGESSQLKRRRINNEEIDLENNENEELNKDSDEIGEEELSRSILTSTLDAGLVVLQLTDQIIASIVVDCAITEITSDSQLNRKSNDDQQYKDLSEKIIHFIKSDKQKQENKFNSSSSAEVISDHYPVIAHQILSTLHDHHDQIIVEAEVKGFDEEDHRIEAESEKHWTADLISKFEQIISLQMK
ncbi:MAG: hypothetical protein EZS28_021968, partial [Streblomastix strix]